MEGIGGLLVLLLAGVLLIAGQLFERFGRKARDRQAPAQTPEQEHTQNEFTVPPHIDRSPRRTDSRTAERLSRERSIYPSTAALVPLEQSLAGRENLRRAVVLMTILGAPVSERRSSELPADHRFAVSPPRR